jgi:hypothetical protein
LGVLLKMSRPIRVWIKNRVLYPRLSRTWMALNYLYQVSLLSIIIARSN